MHRQKSLYARFFLSNLFHFSVLKWADELSKNFHAMFDHATKIDEIKKVSEGFPLEMISKLFISCMPMWLK